MQRNNRLDQEELENNLEQTEAVAESTLSPTLESEEAKAAIRAKNKQREDKIDRLREDITNAYNNNALD